jgi:nitrite reductase/ring-hydroxylating ferredoxin subunit
MNFQARFETPHEIWKGSPPMSDPWIDVASSTDLPDGRAIEVLVDGIVVAVFRDQQKLFALDGMCAHQGGPIAKGHVANGCVTCPWHGWQYELASGIQTMNRQPLMQTYEVRERDGRIEVQASPRP